MLVNSDLIKGRKVPFRTHPHLHTRLQDPNGKICQDGWDLNRLTPVVGFRLPRKLASDYNCGCAAGLAGIFHVKDNIIRECVNRGGQWRPPLDLKTTDIH